MDYDEITITIGRSELTVRRHSEAAEEVSQIPSRLAEFVGKLPFPAGSILMLVGGKPMGYDGHALAIHLPDQLAAGAFLSYPDAVHHVHGAWDHLIWVGDKVAALAVDAGGYCTVVIRHEVEHARIADEDIRAAALATLVEYAAGPSHANLDVSRQQLPHERRCDLASLQFAEGIHGRGVLLSDLERSGASASHLLDLMKEPLAPPEENTFEALLSFAKQHELEEKISGFWEGDSYSVFTKLLDRKMFQ